MINRSFKQTVLVRALLFGSMFIVVLLFTDLLIKDVSISGATTEERNQTQLSYEPPNEISQKIRIGYLEGEEYINFAGNLHAIIIGLETLGWLENLEELPYTQGQENTAALWHWLATNDIGPYIEFVKDAHYSLLGADYSEDDVINRLAEREDIDLMIGMGTVAGKALAHGKHSVPSMVFSASNAVQSTIIQSVEDSGEDHIWAHMDAERYKKQVEVFYDIFEFKKLGMVYENTDVGRVYAAVDDVHQVAEQRKFEVKSFHINESVSDQDREERYYSEVLAAFKELAEEVDAMYLTVGTWEMDKLSVLLQPFYEKQIPVFSQLGSEEVAHGALMSVARQDFLEVGLFFAQSMGRVFNGEKPRNLLQSYGHTPTIALNLGVAENIDYKAPFEILLVADEIFHEIEGE